MLIALKIDLPDRFAANGVPALLDVLRRNRAGASFLAPPERFDALKPAQEAGFEIGLLNVPARSWRTLGAAESDTELELRMRSAVTTFCNAFGCEPQLHATAGWHGRPHALRLTQRLGFTHASDTRGRHPFVPVWNGEIVRCPQLPTSLPTIEELGRPEIDANPIRDTLLDLTSAPAPMGHVFSLYAGGTSQRHLALIESLLTGWREQGHEAVPVQALAARFGMDKLSRHELVTGTLPGHRDTVLLQGNEFLSEWRQAA